MTWHSKEYPRVDTRKQADIRVGFVQRIHGAARYHGVEPGYVVHRCSTGGDPIANAMEYLSQGSYKATDALKNKAYAKLKDKVSNPASLGVSMAEYKSSFDMIAKRGGQLLRAYRALRRFDLPRVAKELSLPKDVQRTVQRKVSKKHLATQNWLEYWMGWAPLVNDIKQCVEVVTRETPQTIRLKVAATEKAHRVYGGSLPNPWPPRYDVTETRAFGYFATVRVSNPNAYFASQLGLTNPVAIAWELVPFSFIANWFVNVDQVLGSYTDFMGLEVSDSGFFFKNSISGSSIAHTWDPSGNWLMNRSCNWSGVFFQRVAGPIERPALVFEMPNRLSLTRAATSISLLTQLFIKP